MALPPSAHGILNVLGGVRLYDADASHYVALRSVASLNATYEIIFPLEGPPARRMMTLGPDGTLQFDAIPTGGGGGSSGTVTSVSLSLPTAIFDVSPATITDSGTFTVTLDQQSAGTFFAGPTSGSATPAFRAIAFSDVSGLIGTTGSSFAAGNDSRFHTQGTDAGTTLSNFQIDSGNSGPRLANGSGTLIIRNGADNANAPLTCSNLTVTGNLTVEGTTFTVNSETLTIDDNIIVLNNNVATGTPTENGGIQVRRGGSAPAEMLWNETIKLWEAGTTGATRPIARYFERTFVAADLVGGILTVDHNLGRRVVPVTVVDESFIRLNPDRVTYTNANSLAIDLTSFTSFIGSNTWSLSVG